MKKILLLLPIVLLLSSCGIVRMNEVSQMSQGQVANMSDEQFCEDARRFIILGEYVPVNVIKDAKRRGLEYCINPDQKF
ncbi:hypothetical protein OAT33_04175 [Methylophilaceae bacterium]|nr:hypothetical protein [Methylophilaceae bacterium]